MSVTAAAALMREAQDQALLCNLVASIELSEPKRAADVTKQLQKLKCVVNRGKKGKLIAITALSGFFDCRKSQTKVCREQNQLPSPNMDQVRKNVRKNPVKIQCFKAT